MIRSNSLKQRIVTAAFAMTFVICLLFSFGLFVAFEFTEESLFEQHLESDITTYINQYAILPEIIDIPRDNFQVFVSENDDVSQLPEYLRNVSEDEVDLVVNGELLELQIRRVNNTSFYFLFEEGAMDSLENFLTFSIFIIILVICIISIFLGIMFSNRIIRPVTDLVDRVNNLERAEEFDVAIDTRGEDEVKILSQAIDSFQLRVTELLRREREFSSDASHELRTPLMGIQAAAENIQRSSSGNERITELSHRIEERCKQMQSLIDSMLFLARDPHSLENDFEEIKLLDIVNDQMESAAPYIENKGVKTLVIEDGSPIIFSSPAILRVVFGNLLRNAVLHSESTDVHIGLFDDGFVLKDFGNGIPDAIKDRLFERYSNGGGGIGGNSNGIGLSLVKRLCDHFNWELTVESSREVGTSITVNFRKSIRE